LEKEDNDHPAKQLPPVADGVDGPLRHQLCQNEVVANLRQGSRP
jgi:hypothetical protein